MKHIASLALAASLVVGCSGDGGSGPNPPPPPPPPAPATASITTPLVPPAAWIPSTVTVRAGGTVTFKTVAGSPAPHNVKSATNVWPLTTIEAGESFDVTLADPGQYPFTCTLHPGMNGTIIVK